MPSTSRVRIVVGVGVLALILAVAQLPPPSRTAPPPRASPPSAPAQTLPTLESRLEAGSRVVARWDLPADRSGVKIVLAQAGRSAPGVTDEVQVVVAWLRDGAWQVATESAVFHDTPATACRPRASTIGGSSGVGPWAVMAMGSIA